LTSRKRDGPVCGVQGQEALLQFNIERIYFPHTNSIDQTIQLFFLTRNQMLNTLKIRSSCFKSKLLVTVDTTTQSCHWAPECFLSATTREMHLWRDLKNNRRTYKHGFISCPTWQAWRFVITLTLIHWVSVTSIMTGYSSQLHIVRLLRWKHVRVQVQQSIFKIIMILNDSVFCIV